VVLNESKNPEVGVGIFEKKLTPFLFEQSAVKVSEVAFS
jgi:hypothetical protein